MAGLPNSFNAMAQPARLHFLGGGPPSTAQQGLTARQQFHGDGNLAVFNIITNPGRYNVSVGFSPDNNARTASGTQTLGAGQQNGAKGKDAIMD